MRALQRTRALAAGVVVLATLVLTVQLAASPPVTVSVGGREALTRSLGVHFGYRDAVVIAAAACLLGASGTYLLVGDRERAGESARRRRTAGPAESPEDDGGDGDPGPAGDRPGARREEWETAAERLAGNERVVYETVLDADGTLPQSDVVERTDLSKATVSRTLDSLEARGLVERKRRGMGNAVVLT